MRARIKDILRRTILISLASILCVTSVSYGIDYVIFRRRVSTNRQPFGQLMIYSYGAVPQKGGKTKFIFNSPQKQTCSNSLFPRAGCVPCWYLQRHTEPRTDF